MTDIKMPDKSQNQNQTMRQEQAKAEVSRQPHQDEKNKLDQERHQKSAIGSGETRSETGEPGRARSELDDNKKQPAGEQR